MNYSDSRIPQYLSSCSECIKKQNSIEKYLQLINLLKARYEKSEKHSQLSKQYNQSITQNETQRDTQILLLSKNPLPLILDRLYLKRIYNCFSKLSIQGNYKLHALIIDHKVNKILKKKAFEKLVKKAKSKQSLEEIEYKMNLRIDQSFTVLKNYKQKIPLNDILKSVDNMKQTLSSLQKRNNQGVQKNLVRKNFLLTQQNNILKKCLAATKKQLQDQILRQEKQSYKKKESLEMLAQDIAEKDELISEMKDKIKFYEKKFQIQDQVLEDQAETMKKQICHLEKINQRLNYDLTKLNDKLSASRNQVKDLQGQLQKYIEDNEKIERQNLRLSIQNENHRQNLNSLQNTMEAVEKKVIYLKKLEQSLNHSKRIFSKSIMKDSKEMAQIQQLVSLKSIDEEIKNQLSKDINKIQLVFKYLKDIQQNGPPLKNQLSQNLTEQELDILSMIYDKIIQHHYISNIQSCNDRITKKVSTKQILFQQYDDQINANKRDVFDSVLDVMEQKKLYLTHRSSQMSQKRQPRQNLTIKLLEMELQKNSYVQKISDLKNRILHIRNVMLNLLKSLQLKNVSKQALEVIQLVFDMFQYSQEQKMEIFPQTKKKSFFSIF